MDARADTMRTECVVARTVFRPGALKHIYTDRGIRMSQVVADDLRAYPEPKGTYCGVNQVLRAQKMHDCRRKKW